MRRIRIIIIRWQRPNGQLVKPDFFIPYVEEIGIISLITNKVIDIVFKEMENFLSQNKKLHVAINVSAHDIQFGNLVEILENKISTTKIERQQIWLELTERTFLALEETKKMIQFAQKLDYIIVIDDFGTGFSNLSYLQNFPINVMKIDKSFIASLGMSSVTSHVTDHIINLAKSLNIALVGEGVEKQTQYDYLKKRKVNYIPGYLFSKPLPADEFIDFSPSNIEL